jgi:hypothetical protein
LGLLAQHSQYPAAGPSVDLIGVALNFLDRMTTTKRVKSSRAALPAKDLQTTEHKRNLL